MKEHLIPFKNTRTSKIVFLLSIIASGYWWLGHGINIYGSAIVGAIFEMLWLPLIGMLFLLPIFSLIFLLKEKINIRSLYLYSLLINVATICCMIFSE